MDRKPQQQTLSIRISESLREFLERSRRVIAAGREDSVSISDVAKILLESAKDDRLDYRLEVAELGREPTDSLVAIRRKWESGQPRTRAEWTFMAQYIQISCEELTENPLAPSAETYATLLEALLVVRALRTDRGAVLDKYYLGNLIDGGLWSQRKLDEEVVPNLIGRMIEEIRTSGNGKAAAGVGRCFYVALRDEEIEEIVSLNNKLQPHMKTLFRMAARGHWIAEKRPVRSLRDGPMAMGSVPTVRQGDLAISVAAGDSDVSFSMSIDGGNLIYPVSGYAQIHEFGALLKALKPESIWNGVNFHAVAYIADNDTTLTWQFRRKQDGVFLSFNNENWERLKDLFLTALEQPKLRVIFEELSLIYGEL